MIQQPGPTAVAFAATTAGGTDLVATGGALSYLVLGMTLGEWMAVIGFVAVLLSIAVNLKALFKSKDNDR